LAKRIGQCAGITRLTFKENRHPIPPTFGNMAIKAIDRCIELPADKPLSKRRFPLERLLPRLLPLQEARLLFPELQTISIGLRIHLFLRIGSSRKLWRWGKGSILREQILK